MLSPEDIKELDKDNSFVTAQEVAAPKVATPAPKVEPKKSTTVASAAALVAGVGAGESKSNEKKNIYVKFVDNIKISYKKTELEIKKNNEDLIKTLNTEQQLALFILLNSRLTYKIWNQVSFLNYILSHKKGWGSTEKSEFEAILKGSKKSPFQNVTKKDIVENSYFMRMIFINEMIKSVMLTTTLNDKINQKKGGVKINFQKGGAITIGKVMKILQVGFCAVMWAIVCNNYYEKLEGFGPHIESLIDIHYKDVISQVSINKLENVRRVIHERISDSDTNTLQIFDPIDENPDTIDLDDDDNIRVKLNNLQQLEQAPDIQALEGDKSTAVTKAKPQTKEITKKVSTAQETEGAAGPAGDTDTVKINANQLIRIMAGGGPSTLVFGNSENPIDLIRTFETEITQAFAQDALNIIKERTVEMAPNYERSAGNENSIVSNVGNYVTNLYALIFQGSATQYNSAPGMSETLASYRRRIRALKNRWNNWANEATTANENFIQDVILHIRNTSYYLWIYFIFIQAIEL